MPDKSHSKSMPCISKPYLQVQNEHQAVAREHEGCPSVARNDFEMRIGTEPCQKHGLGSWKHGSRPKSMAGVKFREVSMRGTVTAREVASKDVQHYCGNTTADSGKFVGNGTCNASCVFAYTLLLHVAKSLATRTLYRKTNQAKGAAAGSARRFERNFVKPYNSCRGRPRLYTLVTSVLFHILARYVVQRVKTL